MAGGASHLGWTTSNATSFSLDHNIGTVTPTSGGSVTVTPSITTTYTGTATGTGGTVHCSATVTVSVAPPAPVCTLTVGAIDESAIDYNNDNTFDQADAQYLLEVAVGTKSCPAGKICDVNGDGKVLASDALMIDTYVSTKLPTHGLYTLSWTTHNATGMSIDQGIGGVIPIVLGHVGVSPTVTTTYTGTATGAGGTAHCSATITIGNPPPLACTLSAAPESIKPGETSNLSWTTNGSTFTIDHDVGAVTPVAGGSVSVSPQTSTTYTGTATRNGQSVHCAATVTVTPNPAPVCTLSANPTSVDAGHASVLSWTTEHGASFTIDHGVGVMSNPAVGTTTTGALGDDTTFTGTVRSADGQTATCTATVTINHGGSAPACTLSANPTSVNSGNTSVLSWTTSNAVSFVIDHGVGTTTSVISGSTTTPKITSETTFTGTAKNSAGQAVTCTAPVRINTTGCTRNCGGGGGHGGGGSSSPNVLLSSVPHGQVAGAYVYLSQIPYTGLDLGPMGTMIYWIVLLGWSALLAYIVLFNGVPAFNRFMGDFGQQVSVVLNTPASGASAHPVPVVTHAAPPAPAKPVVASPAAAPQKEAPRSYSSFDGFKSFAKNEVLTIEDIVKGLTRANKIPTQPAARPANTEPIYQNVEPVYENVDPIEDEPVASVTEHVAQTTGVSTEVRGFAHALLAGDREGVFAGLRQHVRGGGKPEQLVSQVAFLLDDAYRARVEGTECDADIARQAARLNTKQLESLVTSLTTAIDSSYSTGVTGAKLALTRALAVLGA